MPTYTHDLEGLERALLDTAIAWNMISERGCYKTGIIFFLRRFCNECPCCEFAFTARDDLLNEANTYIDTCNLCPLAGEWHHPARTAPCREGLYGDWCKLSPKSPEARRLAKLIATKALNIAYKIAHLINQEA